MFDLWITLTEMKFQILSDIHTEFPNVLEKMPKIEAKAPILCLLGDIGYPSSDKYKLLIKKVAKRFKHVFIVAGNHEYYYGEFSTVNQLIDEICKQYENVHYLNQRSYYFKEENIKFCGCTLWTDIPEQHKLAIEFMVNDYRKIKYGNEQFTVEIQNKLHKEDLTFIKSEIENAKKNKQKLIILTHHSPTSKNTLFYQSTEPPLMHMCFTNLEHLMGDPVIMVIIHH